MHDHVPFSVGLSPTGQQKENVQKRWPTSRWNGNGNGTGQMGTAAGERIAGRQRDDTMARVDRYQLPFWLDKLITKDRDGKE